MSPPASSSSPARSLDVYGAASRCLLYLWENQGNPPIPDGDFLRRYGDRFPHWTVHPGELDDDSLGALAQDFGFSTDMTRTDDYLEVLQAHRYGHAIVVATRCAPVQQLEVDGARPQKMVLAQMDEDGFAVWCPFDSGASAVLPRADRAWWRHWSASALVLRPTFSAST